MKLKAKEQDIKDAGLAMWYPNTFGAEWSDMPPTTPGWYWFDSGKSNAGLYFLQKRKYKDELFAKVYGKPPFAKDAQPNQYLCMKRFVGRWSKPDSKLFSPE